MCKCFIGIDPSINCSGISMKYDNKIKHYVICKTKKSENLFKKFDNIITKRFNKKNKDLLQKILFFVDIIYEIFNKLKMKKVKEVYVGLEGYSYNSTGTLAEIGEFIGVLKYVLYIIQYELNIKVKIKIYPPTKVKKHGSGHGHAYKGDLVVEFLEKYPEFSIVRDREEFKDLVDSYFLLELIENDFSKGEKNGNSSKC